MLLQNNKTMYVVCKFYADNQYSLSFDILDTTPSYVLAKKIAKRYNLRYGTNHHINEVGDMDFDHAFNRSNERGEPLVHDGTWFGMYSSVLKLKEDD